MIRAVLLDWGDTVMRGLAYPGPMALWPRVAVVPDAAAVLGLLAPRYRLALATNAAESDQALIVAALARVGLADYFTAIYTARDLGSAKPEHAFFAGAVRDLGVAPSEAAMVGDSYEQDVRGANGAGLWAIWFNEAGRVATRPFVHHAEIATLGELPDVLGRLAG